MNKFVSLLWVGLITLSAWAGHSAAAQDAENCPDAPTPRLIIGAMGRITPGDANKVRDIPTRTGTLVGSIPAGDAFTVLEGAVCADGYYWWRVDYDGLIGWTVEGASGEYWSEPYTPAPVATPLPARTFQPVRPVVNVLSAGVQARVISDDPNSLEINLAVRSAAAANAEVVTRLATGDLVTVLSDGVESDGYFWREIETDSGLHGWVIEGIYEASADRYDRTLLPACPVTNDTRLAFFFVRYIYTANTDGSEACIYDKMRISGWFTYYPDLAAIDNTMIWRPDHSEFIYVDTPAGESYNQGLYSLSADGMTRRAIAPDNEVHWAQWSPDGERLVIAQEIRDASTSQIWTMNADGSLYSALTSGNNAKQWAAWLDNETLIYVESIGDVPNQIGPTVQSTTFYTINLLAGGLKTVFRSEDEIWLPLLSPDRTQLLVQGWEIIPPPEDYPYGDRGAFRAVVVDLASGDVTPIEDMGYGVSWLPDGRLMSHDGETLSLYDLSDGEITRTPVPYNLPSDFYAYFVDTLPDGRKVYITDGPSYTTSDDDLLAAVDIMTGDIEILIGGINGE